MNENDRHGEVPEETTSAIPGRDDPEEAARRREIGGENEVPEDDVMKGEEGREPPPDVMGDSGAAKPDVMGTRKPSADEAFGDDAERIER